MKTVDGACYTLRLFWLKHHRPYSLFCLSGSGIFNGGPDHVIGRLNKHHRRNPKPQAQGLYLPGVQPAFPT
jgi:hypothetical protein